MATLALGSAERPLRVAVIGSGPSAFYAVEALFKTANLACRVDMFDRLPTPYGLVRGGVAPDHQKIKSVVKVYEKIAADSRLRFFGNVMLGRDIQMEDLDAHYDHVVFAHGNEGERGLGIPGEDLAGVHSATEFVGWYNGHPDFADRVFDLANAERVVVVGNGNVAMDVTRVLLRDPDELAPTDISEAALEVLRASKVREVVLLGRRGAAQAAFSPKEIEEIAKLKGVEVIVAAADQQPDPVSAAWLADAAPRSAQRNAEFLAECPSEPVDATARRASCVFRASPVELHGEGGRVTRVRVQRNELYADADGTPRPRGTDEHFEVEAQLVFKAVGYRGVPIPGVPFCENRGVVPNQEGRVREAPGGAVLPGRYVVGWAKRGPTGLIGNNSPDSKATIAHLVEDLAGATAAELAAEDAERMPALLRERGIDFVDLDDWNAYDGWERSEGERLGKVRRKLTDIAAIVATMKELRGGDR